MSKVAIVTTSINARPESYVEWAKGGVLIVAGDLNSPDELEHHVDELGGLYLPPERQETWSFSKYIGWRNIQRRNIAVMTAYAEGFDYILTVDDDNHPLPSGVEYVNGMITNMGYHTGNTVYSPTNQLNTGMLCNPPFHQRGVPYGLRTDQYFIAPANPPEKMIEIVVCQSQVIGDPDCDAVERMVNRPLVTNVRANVVVTPGCYAAFNSQATMWKAEWAPVMAVLPHLGRYDDIFASFIFHRLARQFNVALYVGTPTVRQDRNQHNLINDLKAELWGMNTTLSFCDTLNTAMLPPGGTIISAYEELMYAAENVLPPQTILFARAWIEEWRNIERKRA